MRPLMRLAWLALLRWRVKRSLFSFCGWSGFRQIHTDEFVLAAGVKEAIGKGREGADVIGKNLGAGIRLAGFGSGLGTHELAAFCEDKQLVARQSKGGSTDVVLLP